MLFGSLGREENVSISEMLMRWASFQAVERPALPGDQWRTRSESGHVDVALGRDLQGGQS